MIKFCHAWLLSLTLLFLPQLDGPVRATEKKIPEIAEFEGTLVPAREGEITPIVSAWLNKINFVPGQYVEKGAVLFEFNTKPQLARVRLAKAQLAGAQAQLKDAEARLRRTETLKTKDVVAEANLQQAQAARDVAAAKVDEARANLDLLMIALTQYEQKAPFAGVMSEPMVAENGWQDTGGSGRDNITMAVITQLDPIHVVGEVPYETYAKRLSHFKSDQAIKDGLVLFIILPDGEVYPHEGRLVSGGYKFDEASQKLRIWAEFPNPDKLLRPGLKVMLQSRPVE